jgi:hypothetical protein
MARNGNYPATRMQTRSKQQGKSPNNITQQNIEGDEEVNNASSDETQGKTSVSTTKQNRTNINKQKRPQEKINTNMENEQDIIQDTYGSAEGSNTAKKQRKNSASPMTNTAHMQQDKSGKKEENQNAANAGDNMEVDQTNYTDQVNSKQKTNSTEQNQQNQPLQKIPESKLYKVICDPKNIPGVRFKKVQILKRMLLAKYEFSECNFIRKKKDSFMQVTLTNEESYNNILKEEFIFTNKEDEEPTKFFDLYEMRPEPTEQEIQEEKGRTIQVLDIPLFVKPGEVKTIFQKYGNIVKMNTRVRGLYQTAYITYETADEIHTFYST